MNVKDKQIKILFLYKKKSKQQPKPQQTKTYHEKFRRVKRKSKFNQITNILEWIKISGQKKQKGKQRSANAYICEHKNMYIF